MARLTGTFGWFARICTAAVLAHTLIGIDPQYPEVTAERRADLLMVKGELEAQAPKGAPADPFAAKKAKKEAKKAKKAKAAAKAEPKKAEAKKAAADRVAGNGSRLPGAAVRGERGSAGPEPFEQQAEVDDGDPHGRVAAAVGQHDVLPWIMAPQE